MTRGVSTGHQGPLLTLGQSYLSRWTPLPLLAVPRGRHRHLPIPGALSPVSQGTPVCPRLSGSDHFDVSKILLHLQSQFYWPGCRQDVELYVHRVTTALPKRARPITCMLLCNSTRWGLPWNGWQWTSWVIPYHRPGQPLCPGCYGLLYQMA